MVGLQTLDLPIEVQILCPQPVGESTLHKQQGAFTFLNPITVYAQHPACTKRIPVITNRIIPGCFWRNG